MCAATDKVFVSKSYTQLEELDADYIIALLQKSPLAATVCASAWSYYSSGILSSSATCLNHVVLLTGYTPDYWILKNEWGQDWGEAGYIRVSRNPDQDSRVGSEIFFF